MWKAKREAPLAFKRSRTTKGKNLLVRWRKNPAAYPEGRSCSTTDKKTWQKSKRGIKKIGQPSKGGRSKNRKAYQSQENIPQKRKLPGERIKPLTIAKKRRKLKGTIPEEKRNKRAKTTHKE